MKDELSYKCDFKQTFLNDSKYLSTDIISKDKLNKIADLKIQKLVFSRSVRGMIFFLIVLTNLIINMDHGTIPSATSEIKEDRKIDDAALGIFGSLVYLGNLLGSMIFMSVFRNSNRRKMIILSLIMILIFIYLFAFLKNVYLLYLTRTITGIFQSFLAIYFPVWCDQYGPKNRRGSMIALLQICVPLGVVLGYILTAVIKEILNWYYSLYIQCALTGVVILVFLFIPSIYFSPSLHNEKETASHKSDDNDNVSFYKDSLRSTDIRNNLWDDLRILGKNYLFLSCSITLSILYFIITAVQFWASDYLRLVLKTNEYEVSIAFTFTCISAPTIGIIVGGCVLSYSNGPESIKSLVYCLLFSIGAMLCSIPIPFAQNVYSFTGLLWFILFFGGAMVPIITSIIITSVTFNLRTSGNSLSNFMSNLLGYLPAPFVYGLISKYSPGTPRLAMTVTMNFSALGVLFISMGVYFKYKQQKESNINKEQTHIIVKSDLQVNVTIISKLWGNKNLNNNEEMIQEGKIYDVTNFIENKSFKFDCSNTDGGKISLQNNLILKKETIEKTDNNDDHK